MDSKKRNNRLTLCVAGFVLATSSAFAQVQKSTTDELSTAVQEPDVQTIAIRQTLTQRYPNTKFTAIKRAAVAGLWEVSMGVNVAYVTEDVRFFLFGHLFDMQTQTDLTAARIPASQNSQSVSNTGLNFKDLPFENAIKTVRGTGLRKIAVFTDVDCPYCQDLELSLAKLKDVTIYTFLFPLASIHPEAVQKSVAIWCAPDRDAAWQKFVTKGLLPSKQTACPNPVAKNIELASKSGIQGTPYIIFSNGDKAAGALDIASLEQRLATTH